MTSNEPFFKIWRINMRTRTLQRDPVPNEWEKLGGRGLSAKILLDEGVASCEPLGPYNKLVFSTGLLVGHMLSSGDRISIGGKSPLTGGIKEANAGGRTGLQLAHLGIRALIIEDHPEDDGLWILYLNSQGAAFEPAADLRGKGVYETASSLAERYGQKAAIALIGPGGELKLRTAGIQNVDKDGTPSRIAARGGLGAVMASKGLKAIVIDGASGQKPPIVDPAAFKTAQKEYTQAVMAAPQTKVYHDFGTVGILMLCQQMGALPTNNFSMGAFEKAEELSAETFRETLLGRKGECEVTHACMNGCVIQSSNTFGDSNGKTIVSPLEYESISLMGSNLGIAAFDDIARMNFEVNDLGLDSIEVGAVLGVAVQAGLLEFGDSARALELIGEIRKGTPLGRLLGSGAAVFGQVYGIERVPTAKGQAFSGYDPRAVKGTGVTYATSPQGADHTCGLTIRAKVDHLDPKIQVPLSRNAQINMAGYDTLGLCTFSGFGVATAPHVLSMLLNARYGWGTGVDILQVLGRETLKIEREFNRQAGFTPADDRLPEWMRREPLPPTNAVFDVSAEDLDSVFDW
jgi:aldehyde:ferredoxin oxidoreductase